MKKLIIFLLIAIGFHSIGIGQSKRKIALNQIEELKNGVLLVRLQKENRKIKYLAEQSRTEEIREVEDTTNAINNYLVEAFTEYYDFCPVYFFYSDHTTEIKEEDYSILFDSDNNQIEKIDNQNVFLAAYTYRDMGESYLTDHKTIVIMDDKIRQLRKPFPYYPYIYLDFYRGMYSQYMRRNRLDYFGSNVELINSNLTGYFEKTSHKREKLKYKRMRKANKERETNNRF